METNGEGVQEGGPSPPQLLTKGTLYSLSDNPKVTWLHHGSTLPLPFPGEAPGPNPSFGAKRIKARDWTTGFLCFVFVCFVFSFDSPTLKPRSSPLPLLYPKPGKVNPEGISRQIIHAMDGSSSLEPLCFVGTVLISGHFGE